MSVYWTRKCTCLDTASYRFESDCDTKVNLLASYLYIIIVHVQNPEI